MAPKNDISENVFCTQETRIHRKKEDNGKNGKA